MVIGNLGDSRAILGTRDSNNRLMPVQLTVDLKPNVPSMAFFLIVFFSLLCTLQINVCENFLDVHILFV